METETQDDSTQAKFEEFKVKLQEAMQQYHVPGVAAGIIYGDRELVACYGITNANNPQSVDQRTLFLLASITKTYTATLIIRLVEQGKLALDRPIIEYLPDFKMSSPETTAGVTLRHLLTHTAGWEGDLFLDFDLGDNTLTEYVSRMAELPQITPVGKYWAYNNAGFMLAGRVVEKVVGKPFEAVMRELLFEPLGLKESFFFPAEAILHRVAVGHDWQNETLKVVANYGPYRTQYPAGGIISNIRDQLIYTRFQMGDGRAQDGTRLLSQNSLKIMQSAQVMLSVDRWEGLSWIIANIGGQQVVNHGGNSNGQKSNLLMVPAHNFAIYFLTNGERGSNLHTELTFWALKEFLGMSITQPQTIELDNETLASYVGLYKFALNEMLIKMEEGQLTYQIIPTVAIYNKEILPPSPISPVAFLEKDKALLLSPFFNGSRIEFFRNGEGEINWLRAEGRIGVRQ